MGKLKNFTTKIELGNLEYYYRHWRFLGFDVFTYYSHQGAGWFRLFGREISWKDMNRHSLMFSERYGYTKYLKVGKYAIKKLC